MGKQQDWSVAACVFLFLSLTSQIHSTNPNRLFGSRRDKNHINAFRRANVPSSQINITQKEKDLIEKLPGQPQVSFKQYSGYVTVNETAERYLFYYFVETINANKSAPLVIWFNGGPGCSSLGGLFLEHGPFRVHSDGKTLYNNPYSWNNEVNMLYLEAPVGVGFSYSKAPVEFEANEDTPTVEFKANEDTLTAEENYIFLVKWLERFPEYKGRDFYISGQSYAGHYVPQLAQQILRHNKQTPFINLQGVIVGNPGLHSKTDWIGADEYLVTHALISQEIMDNMKRICKAATISKTQEDLDRCFHEKKYVKKTTKHLNLYNIYADVCLNETLTDKPKKNPTVLSADPCSKPYLLSYLNRANVQEAIHVAKLPHKWIQCNGNVQHLWGLSSEDDIRPVINEIREAGIRVWIYSGDTDAMVPVTSTMLVLKGMNLTTEKTWRAWFSEGQLAGYVEEYKDNLTYLTVRGAGHSVPSDQPVRALELFTSFIRNKAPPSA
ncbi:unnamed protein product [Cochlearia groenlandica]